MSSPAPAELPDLSRSHHSLGASRTRLLVYLAGILVPMLLMLVAGFVVMPTEWFARHSSNAYLANMGYGETLHGADCKVLIYGDSAAMVGLDPATIQGRTGLPTCNIAEYAGLTVINGTLVLDRYLANNPRPRYILFVFAPEDYAAAPAWKDVDVVEGLIYRLRYKRDLSTALLLLEHPADTLSWLERGLHFMLLGGAGHAAISPALLNLRVPYRGRFPVSAPPLPTCAKVREAAPDTKRIGDLRSRYGQDGTRVIVDVMPVPDCDPSYGFYRDKFVGVADNAPIQYPRFDYIDNGRLHLGSAGIERLSNAVGDQIAALERAR